jgi:hypothetical protein
MSYISTILYSLSEVKGIAEKKRARVPKWEERLEELASHGGDAGSGPPCVPVPAAMLMNLRGATYRKIGNFSCT